jgi:hypothetical protein
VFLLLAGCAGSQAMQWKPLPRKPCSIQVCEIRGPDKVCGCTDHRGLRRILGEL